MEFGLMMGTCLWDGGPYVLWRRRLEQTFCWADTHLRDWLAKLHCGSRAGTRGGAMGRSNQPSLELTGLGIWEREGEHGLLQREAGVADTGRHVGLGGHQGLRLEHWGQHLDTVNGHAELGLLTMGRAGGARDWGRRRRDIGGVGCGHDHRGVRLTRQGGRVGRRWGHWELLGLVWDCRPFWRWLKQKTCVTCLAIVRDKNWCRHCQWGGQVSLTWASKNWPWVNLGSVWHC